MESLNPDAPLVPTPATEWKGSSQAAGTDLQLPSGNVARVRRLAPTAFLSKGILPDPLSEIVRKAVNEKKGLRPEKIKEMAKDPEKIQASLELFDRVLAQVMVIPAVRMPPKCVHPIGDGEVCDEYYNVDGRHADVDLPNYHPYKEGTRHKDILYADTVDLVDKMYVFNFVMTGTRDLESFREFLKSGLGDLSDGEDVQLPA